MIPQTSRKPWSALTAFSLGALLSLNISAQIIAVDDGATGSPVATTSEDSQIIGGASVTANDTGAFEVLTPAVTSEKGSPVTIDTTPATLGQFTYNPKANPLAQALASGESFEDSFEYGIVEIASPTPGITNELDPTAATNTTGWANLPPTIAPDAGAPSTFAFVYDYSGTATASTRTEFVSGTEAWNTKDMSLEFWIKQDTLENVTLWETGGSGTGSGLFLADSGVVRWVVKTGAAQTVVESSELMAAGTWHHIVITLDVGTGTSTIFFDGVATGTSTEAANTNWSGVDDAGLGGVNGDAGGDSGNPGNLATFRNPFNGQLGLFRFYSAKTLIEAEVQANRNTALASVDTATVTLEVTGENDVPRATVDVFRSAAEDAIFTSTRNLLANDGVPGSGLRNLLTMDLPGLTVSQSPSTAAPPGGGVPERAFDQNFRRFTHTDSGNNTVSHSWEVDFGSEVFLDTATLFNRADCCAERLRDITVTVKDAGGAIIFTSPLLNPGNALGFIGNGGGELGVDFGGITGQTVTVTRTPDLSDANASDGSVLSMGEVAIIGHAMTAGDSLLLNYDARYETTNDNWANIGSNNDPLLDWELGSGVTLNPGVISSRAQITSALEWDGTTNATGRFANTRGIHDVLGAAVDQQGATFEAWVKLAPADLAQISTIFEAGGGSGFGLAIDNGVLKAACELETTAGVQSAVNYDLNTDDVGVLGGQTPTSEFFQVAAAIFPEGGITLYVNGVQVAQTTSGNSNDWDGGDDCGLGHFQGSNHGGFLNTAAGTVYDTHFNGSIAIFRMYAAALDAVDVLEAFKAVDAGTDIDGDSLSLNGIIDGNGVPVAIGAQTTLASGALVTMTNATGGFTYDPNGQFDFLTNGQTATDSFIYAVSDGNGGTGYAEVIVTISGYSNAFDDALALLEGGATTFQPSALIANDGLLSTATNPYLSLTPGSLAGGTWTDEGSSGLNAALAGSPVSAPELESGFGRIGTALGTGGANFTSLDPISTADATVEVWFKPDPAITTGKFTVFETGGNGTGYSIVYDADAGSVVATVDAGNDATQVIQATATGIRNDEFNQLIVVYDRDGGAEVGAGTGIFEDNLTVYLNNDPSAPFDPAIDGSGTNLAGIANDWSGSDGSGIANVNGTSALNENFTGLIGEVAALRVYTRILTTDEMAVNYDGIKQNIVSLVSPSALGMPLTLNADGSFTYDPSTLPDLAPGESIKDSFTYETQDGIGGTTSATVNLIVFGTGTNQQTTANPNSTVVYSPGATAVKIIPPITANDPDIVPGAEVIPLTAAAFAQTTTVPDPGNGGSAIRLNFTPAASDVAPGSTRVIFEIGGTSNGQGVYLADGVPYFIAKMNGGATNATSGFTLDADWNGDNVILVPLSGAGLAPGSPQDLQLSFTGYSLTWKLNGGASTTQALSNLGTRANWSGDDTIGFGARLNDNGGLINTTGLFGQNNFTPIEGTFNFGGLASYPEELITATLTLPVADGSFTAPAGSSYSDDGTTGTWTTTGSVLAVQQLLLGVEFIPTGTSPATATVEIKDGGENGSVPVTGTVVFTSTGDTDDLDTLLEYAFGTDPTVNDSNPLAIDGTTNGTPIVFTDFSGPGVELSAVFNRRLDFGTPGSLNYTAQFSSDLMTWYDSTDTPTGGPVSSANNAYEVAKVAYPLFTPDGKKARYFRIKVQLVP